MDMIGPELEAEILRLYHAEKWRVGTLATQLGVHHSTVRRVLAQAGLQGGLISPQRSMADPYIALIVETLTKYPKLRASRLYTMVKERGYPGGADHFRAIVARYRPRPPAEAFLRLRTLPGEQAQVDWGHFGKLIIGDAQRALFAFVMVLAWSRQIFLRFYLNAAMNNFLRGHVDAFEYFGGVPRELLYDNLKSAVLERAGDAIRFHPTLLELAKHYHFLPHPVAPGRGNEKGRVERAIRYIRDSFFAARTWTDITDLNAQALDWMQGFAAERRCPENRSTTVRQAFAEERSRLLPLPEHPFPTEERVSVSAGKTPYVRFDLNDYSIPDSYVRRTLTVLATLGTVRVLDGHHVIATHERSWDRGKQIEQPAHIAALLARKRQGKEQRGIDRLYHAVPHSRKLLEVIAERGGNLGRTTQQLLELLDSVGAAMLDAAVSEAVIRNTPHLGAVRHLLDRARVARGQPPALDAHLPADPRLQHLVVRPHSLATYDQLRGTTRDEN
jgi:transposase